MTHYRVHSPDGSKVFLNSSGSILLCDFPLDEHTDLRLEKRDGDPDIILRILCGVSPIEVDAFVTTHVNGSLRYG